MSESGQGTSEGPVQLARVFEQGPDAPSFYSDSVQILGTGNEVLLQFYETIPSAPGASGRIEAARSRLRGTVVLSPAHAMRIGELLQEHSSRRPQTGPAEQTAGAE